MTEPRHRRTGETLSEVIAQIPNELPVDAVGLWQIVPIGRDNFALDGDELVDFLRRAIVALLGAGAVPVRHIPNSGFEWVCQKQYGNSPAEIATSIVAEWQTIPDDPFLLVGECPWFARPDSKRPTYVKMD